MANDTFMLSGGISKIESYMPKGGITSSAKNGVTGNLEYVKMLTKDKLTVRIACPNKKLVKSGIAQDFQVNLGNQWSELVPFKSIPIIGDLSQGAFAVAAAGVGATQGSLEALWMSSASWSGSQLPRFSVTLVYLNYSRKAPFINDMLALAGGALTPGPYISVDPETGKVTQGGNRGGDIKEWVNALAEGTTQAQQWIGDQISGLAGSPDENGDASTGYKLTQDLATAFKNATSYGTAAPYDYGLQQDKSNTFAPKPGTTFALEVGKWFKADKLLIESIQPQFSKEVVHSGNPVTMSINVVFRPYRNITFKEFSSYFQIK